MLVGKVVIITGAGSGIGRATALLAAKAGAKVLVADVNEKSAAETVELIEKDSGIAKAVRVDVTSETDIVQMIEQAVGAFGQIHGAFNNAGLQSRQKLVEELTESDWDTVMDVNLKGVFLCMKHEIAAMRKTGGGAIVNTSSGDGVVGRAYAVDYVTSKHGVLGLTRSAAAEALITGVRVNAVLPGMTMTPLVEDLLKDPSFQKHAEAARERHSIGRFGQPEDVGRAANWLLSDEASFINGACLPVDGGYTAR